ncbi:MAG: hypothetical protein R3E50_02535 [Halioglobus sp.]
MDRSQEVYVENEPTTRIKTVGKQNQLPRDEIAARQLEHLEHFVRSRDGRTRAAGLKLSHRSLIEPQLYLGRLLEHGFAMVLLLRDNFLRSAVSQLRAETRAKNPDKYSREWENPWAVSVHEPKPGPMHIDAELAIRVAGEFAHAHSATLDSVARVFGQDCLLIEYTELAADPAQVLRRIYSYLGFAGPKSIWLPYRKATSEDLSQDITNYDAFERRVRDAGLARFLPNQRYPGGKR